MKEDVNGAYNILCGRRVAAVSGSRPLVSLAYETEQPKMAGVRGTREQESHELHSWECQDSGKDLSDISLKARSDLLENG